MDDQQYINGDEIKRIARLRGKPIDVYESRREVNERVQNNFKKRQSFGIESNLTSNSSYEIAKEANNQGYQTKLFYIGVDELEKLNQRIDERVIRGFHYISPQEVALRYQDSLNRLPGNLKWFDEANIFDNSVQIGSEDGSEEFTIPTLVLRAEKGILTSLDPSPPKWLQPILPRILLIDEMNRKIQNL